MVDGKSLHTCRTCEVAWVLPSLQVDEHVEQQYLENITSPAEYYLAAQSYDYKTFTIRMKRIRGLTGLRAGRMLDIGCNIGTFLEVAADIGWTPVGVEPNPHAARVASEKGFEVHCGFFDGPLARTFPDFDAVHLGDVIEHVSNPVLFLEQVLQVLRPGGLLLCVTPDFNSVMGRLLQIKPTEHLVYFTKRSLISAVEAAGFCKPTVQRWGRRRSIAAMRHSTTFSERVRTLMRTLDVPIIRPSVEAGFFHMFKDELLLTAYRQ